MVMLVNTLPQKVMLVDAIHQDGAITNFSEMVFHNVKPNLLYSEFSVYITGSYEVVLKWCITRIYLLRIGIILISITRPLGRLTLSWSALTSPKLVSAYSVYVSVRLLGGGVLCCV